MRHISLLSDTTHVIRYDAPSLASDQLAGQHGLHISIALGGLAESLDAPSGRTLSLVPRDRRASSQAAHHASRRILAARPGLVQSYDEAAPVDKRLSRGCRLQREASTHHADRISKVNLAPQHCSQHRKSEPHLICSGCGTLSACRVRRGRAGCGDPP